MLDHAPQKRPYGMDNMTEAGADELCRRIQAHWMRRGFYEVRVEVTHLFDHHRSGPAHGITSNLINGLPPSLAKSDIRRPSR